MKYMLLLLIVLFVPIFLELHADLACLDHPAREGDTVFIGPTASSTLMEGAEPESYSTEKYGIHQVFDGSRNTAWSEGEEGSGIGVEIAFSIPNTASRLRIINGYASTRSLFKANNRVKDITLEILIGVMIGVGQCNDVYTTTLLKKKEVRLKDSDLEQTVELDLAGINLEKRMSDYKAEVFRNNPEINEYFKESDPILICLITIRSVYQGNTYNDTCIAEIAID